MEEPDVILHELVHTQVMHHSHRFWVNLRAVCPAVVFPIEDYSNERLAEFEAENSQAIAKVFPEKLPTKRSWE